MQELYWCRYKGDSKTSYILIYPLEESEGKVKCLLAEKLSDNTVTIMRDHLLYIDIMTPQEKIDWFKEYCPEYGKAFRTYSTDPSKLTILRKYEIKKL